MLPIYKEYCQFLKDKTGLELEEGYYWYDKSIIKAFDSEGNTHKIYRLKINDDLSVSYSCPKKYESVTKFDLVGWSQLLEMKKTEIIDKETESLELIKNKLQNFDGYTPLVPISTGKDSMITLHLVREVIPDTHSIFNNTSLDCADTYRMAKKISGCEIMNPKKGFYQYVETDHMIPNRFSRFCCRIFKTGVMVGQLDHERSYLMFMGMRNQESATRSDYEDEWINKTEWGNTNWQGILPIRTWTELDVWLYIMLRGIEINPKYRRGYARVGCHCACPYYTKSTWVLDDYWYPKARERWMKILEKDFLDNVKWNRLNCTLNEYLQFAWNGGMVRDEPTVEVIDEMQEYKGIADREVVKRYFNQTCHNCGKKIKKDEVGLSFKFFGTDTDRFYCMKCMSKGLNLSKDKLKEVAKMHKNRDCVLF